MAAEWSPHGWHVEIWHLKSLASLTFCNTKDSMTSRECTSMVMMVITSRIFVGKKMDMARCGFNLLALLGLLTEQLLIFVGKKISRLGAQLLVGFTLHTSDQLVNAIIVDLGSRPDWNELNRIPHWLWLYIFFQDHPKHSKTIFRNSKTYPNFSSDPPLIHIGIVIELPNPLVVAHGRFAACLHVFKSSGCLLKHQIYPICSCSSMGLKGSSWGCITFCEHRCHMISRLNSWVHFSHDNRITTQI